MAEASRVGLLARRGGELVPQLVWWPRTLEGPHRDQSGFRRYTNEEARVPVGKWFELTTRVRQSNEFDGTPSFIGGYNHEAVFSVALLGMFVAASLVKWAGASCTKSRYSTVLLGWRCCHA